MFLLDGGIMRCLALGGPRWMVGVSRSGLGVSLGIFGIRVVDGPFISSPFHFPVISSDSVEKNEYEKERGKRTHLDKFKRSTPNTNNSPTSSTSQ